MSRVALAIVVAYLVVTVVVGWLGYRATGTSPSEYFLAGGTLGRVVFPLTMFATLMSAFVFLGSAGFGYVHGFAWFALLGVEALAGIPLAVVGLRAWERARANGYLTPTEFLGDTFDSDAVKLSVLAVQFAWAIPYLAIQATGGGIIFQQLSGGDIPFVVGALVVTLVTAVYLALGGLRGVAWSDALQGVVMVTFLAGAFVWVLPRVDPGGLTRELARSTDLLAPAGNVGFFTPRVWVSFLLMNTLAVLAYPQLFQRFFAAADEQSFRALLRWWPVVTIVAVLVPVVLGAWGTQLLPSLSNPDAVVPALLGEFAPAWFVGLVLGGALAATMSTADSLTLTLSSLVVHDLVADHIAPGAGARTETWAGRVAAAALLLGGFLLALPRSGTIVELAVYFIQGNALVAPVYLAALYWERATATGALAALVLGQGYFVAGAFGPAPAFGFMPFVPALALACLGLVAGSLAEARSAPTPGGEPS